MVGQQIEGSLELSQMEYLPPFPVKLGGVGILESSSGKGFVIAHLDPGDSLGSIGSRAVIHASFVADSNSLLVGHSADSNFETSMWVPGLILGGGSTKLGMSEAGGSSWIFLTESCLPKVLESDGRHLEGMKSRWQSSCLKVNILKRKK